MDASQLDSWRDIVWVGAEWSLCGIDKYGKVVGTFEFDVSAFHDAVQVYEDANITYVLNNTGQIRSVSEFVDNYETIIDRESEKWIGVCEIDCRNTNFTALKKDGTVVSNSAAPYFEKWTDIVEIEAGFGVKSDGSIVMEPDLVNDFTPEQLAEISTWKVMVDPDTIPTPSAQTAAP